MVFIRKKSFVQEILPGHLESCSRASDFFFSDCRLAFPDEHPEIRKRYKSEKSE